MVYAAPRGNVKHTDGSRHSTWEKCPRCMRSQPDEIEIVKEDLCDYCGNKIEVTIFRGTGHCSENCRKLLEGKDDEVVVHTDPFLTNYP